MRSYGLTEDFKKYSKPCQNGYYFYLNKKYDFFTVRLENCRSVYFCNQISIVCLLLKILNATQVFDANSWPLQPE